MADLDGTILVEHRIPRPGVTWVPNRDPLRGRAGDTRQLRVCAQGIVGRLGVSYMVGKAWAGQSVTVTQIDDTTLTFADKDGTILITHTIPGPGVRYVANPARARHPASEPRVTTVSGPGVVYHGHVTLLVGRAARGKQVTITATHDDRVVIAALDGNVLVEYPHPEPGVKYLGVSARLTTRTGATDAQ